MRDVERIQRLRRATSALVIALFAILAHTTTPVQAAPAAQMTSQPVVILVRDGVGSPMQGVPILIYLIGPPTEQADQCVTDDDGMCHVDLFPNAYVLHFVQGWRGRLFIPPSEQNPTGMDGMLLTNDVTGGFGIYVSRLDAVQTFSFVLGVQDDQLVPIWDMTSDPARPPDPYMPATDPGVDPFTTIDLSPLVDTLPSDDDASTSSTTASPSNTTPPSPNDDAATPIATLIVDSIGGNNDTIPTNTPSPIPSTASPTTPAPTSPTAPDSNPSPLIVLGALGIIILVLILLGLIGYLTYLRRKTHG